MAIKRSGNRIDQNLIPSNIKKGVMIYGVLGTYTGGGGTTYTVEFTVKDDLGNAITDAVVTFNGVTNPAGDYIFSGISAGGPYNRQVEKVGYVTDSGSQTVSGDIVIDSVIDLIGYDRYRVGGSGTWDNSNTANWSATSGGVGGESVPTRADNVFFNGDSGTGTVHINGTALECADLNFTNFGGYLRQACTLSVYGSYILYSGMTIIQNWLTTLMGKGTHIINNGGKDNIALELSGIGTYTLAADYTSRYGFTFASGTFDTGGYDMNLFWDFTISGSSTKTINLNDSIIILGTKRNYSGNNLTLNKGTSTIRITGEGGGLDYNFEGGGLQYNNVELNSDTHIITGSNTFNDLKIGKDGAQTITFTDGTDQTVTTFTCVGDVGKVKTLQGSGTGGWNISCDTGTIDCDYIDITYSTAEGGATFNAGANSVDSGNNSGWNFVGSTYQCTFNFTDPTYGDYGIEGYYIVVGGTPYPSDQNIITGLANGIYAYDVKTVIGDTIISTGSITIAGSNIVENVNTQGGGAFISTNPSPAIINSGDTIRLTGNGAVGGGRIVLTYLWTPSSKTTQSIDETPISTITYECKIQYAISTSRIYIIKYKEVIVN